MLGVQSVGPKVAIAVLSGVPPRELLRRSPPATSARFQGVPGIGKRTAERIIVELREKVGARGIAGEQALAVRCRRRSPVAVAREGLIGSATATMPEADDYSTDAVGDTPSH